MKTLEYLNLALNNIRKIEGLERCEFLNKVSERSERAFATKLTHPIRLARSFRSSFVKCASLRSAQLDLTINFIDVDDLEESVDNLIDRVHLKDLYMMGNPAEQEWGGFKAYVIARLPQVSERSERAFWKTRILALKRAKWLQT